MVNLKLFVVCSTTLDENEYAIKPQVHSKYLEEGQKIHQPWGIVGNQAGHFKIEYYPMSKNYEDLSFENELDRLYFSKHLDELD